MEPEIASQKAPPLPISPDTAQAAEPHHSPLEPAHSPEKPSETAINPGSAVASLWIRTSQDNQPPASVPSSIVPVLTCPQCQQRLNFIWSASGLQNCLNCGWMG